MKTVSLDNKLLERIRQGDNQAIKELYKSAFTYCTSFILKDGGSKTEASEFFQRAMLILIEKSKDQNFTIKYNLQSFLYRIVKNQWLNELKRKKKFTNIVGEEVNELPAVSEELAEKEYKESQLQKIFNAIDEISEKCQQLLRLTFFEKKSDREIAPILNFAVDFVRNKRSRCIKKIRQKIASQNKKTHGK